jgi:hypothetical protein
VFQTAEGYRLTVKSGVVPFENGEHSGALPGALDAESTDEFSCQRFVSAL